VNGILNLGFRPLEAACLTKESTRSFPGMPLWEGTHASWIEMPLFVQGELVSYERNEIVKSGSRGGGGKSIIESRKNASRVRKYSGG